jgi:hypothetical protein
MFIVVANCYAIIPVGPDWENWAKVTLADADVLAGMSWGIVNGYACSSGMLMHRAVKPCQPDEVVDHINHDRLDNRRSNLRALSRSVNCQNRAGAQKNSRSGYRGVINAGVKGWRACACKFGKKVYGGYFKTSELAAAAAEQLRWDLGMTSPTA